MSWLVRVAWLLSVVVVVESELSRWRIHAGGSRRFSDASNLSRLRPRACWLLFAWLLTSMAKSTKLSSNKGFCAYFSWKAFGDKASLSITKEVLFAVVVRLSCQQKEASSPRPITEAFVTAVVIMLTSTAVLIHQQSIHDVDLMKFVPQSMQPQCPLRGLHRYPWARELTCTIDRWGCWSSTTRARPNLEQNVEATSVAAVGGCRRRAADFGLKKPQHYWRTTTSITMDGRRRPLPPLDVATAACAAAGGRPFLRILPKHEVAFQPRRPHRFLFGLM